ncbi:MAG: DNA primase small subunit PriS [Candidatus Bathyarchaeota archaeon]|uniref:DNA primase small subunit PriS n=1 Tax=Candidatus Bathycorpusculum sp. TaxID=2994959 RepID=UPI00281EBD3D|nr:DNA primase small subunit PriS [Candidatus Termiticorpusculum sp.]MCL2256698.1 DNA primase small subunit PriS [Candidatus Termiticorpusculum sp.]MCL2293130.1 DNA primase small subunit PriS [Candidatus Termiticorpusculum sp.]
MSSRDFVYSKFAEFYNNPSSFIPAPTSFEHREFAYLMFKERFMVRHKRFESIQVFQSVLTRNVPSDVYHSCAYYEQPDLEMDKKGWIGSDLVFDIDADHIPTKCGKIHDEWLCQKCEFNGKGITPEQCPLCGGDRFSVKTWLCDLCLESTRVETAKLIDMLTKDFGFATNEMHVFFSGHRGYHVHVEDEAVRSLDALSRKEIVDYVTGLGLSVLNKTSKEKFGKGRKRVATAKKFKLHNYGWNRRLKIGMTKLLSTATVEDLKNLELRNNNLFKNKTVILRRAIEEGRWDSIPGVSVATWLKLAEQVKNLESANIDTVVTTDIHRLIRMNGTLHGKTGLLKMEFPAHQLDDFDPLTQAIAFKKGTTKVFVSNTPEFRLGGATWGPYKNVNVVLPTAAAVMLILKGRAEVAN